ncbi:MAG: hypothetical protein H6718_30260 [Polyangiaceae bacterium]|nr:hypothetical protein [Myxococcales bacterium]MCB9589737.1 hypothetical protein [Polyangiaceae bacterium]
MRALPVLALVLCFLGASGCLQIERVPGAEANSAGGSAGQPGDGGLAGDAADYDAGACPNTCMDLHPGARTLFQTMAACIGPAPEGQCTEACTDGASGNTEPSCTTLGVFDPRPTCNACVKDLCCDALTACLADPECFQTSLCASKCP